MTALIEHLNLASPVVKAMIGLLPHLSPPVILEPGPNPLLPRGWLHLPTMKLIVAGAGGPVDPALIAAERIAMTMEADALVVSVRNNHATNAIRFDAIFVEGGRTELFADLLFWTLHERMPAFVPRAKRAPAVIVGRTTLIPSEAMPYADRAERAAGVARGTAEQRLSLWGEG